MTDMEEGVWALERSAASCTNIAPMVKDESAAEEEDDESAAAAEEDYDAAKEEEHDAAAEASSLAPETSLGDVLEI